MAFYEMLPGAGMPPGLQAGMDSVLNKKFGTSTTYPAEDWPDTVNLMGPLPEKTVSSSPIVTFPDGADAVLLKSCEVTIAPTLDGVSSVDVVQTGKNLFDKTAVIDNTWIVVNGTTTESAVGFRTSGYIPVKANTKYFVSTKSSNRSAYYDRNKNGIAYFSFTGGASFTCLYDGYIRITIKNDIDLDTFIANEGNEAITYEPFGTTHTATLGRTIYGGTADVVKGTAEPFNIVSLNRSPLREKIDYGITINQQSESVLNVTTNGTAYSCERLFYSLVAGTYTVKFLSTSSDSYTPLISIYRTGGTGIALSINPNTERTFTLSEDTDIDIRLFASGGGDTTIRTVEFSNFQLEMGSAVHDYSPYFEPFAFDPVPIDSKLGNNTIWSEQGDNTEVTYRADINLALGGN